MRFLSLCSLCGLPAICFIFWFNSYSVIKLFSFSITFVERISELGKYFFFNSIFPNSRVYVLKPAGILFSLLGLSGVHVLFSNTDDPDHGLIILRLEISGNWINEMLLHVMS